MIMSIEDQKSENYAHRKYKPANFTSADWKQWNDAADPSDAPYAEAKTEAPDLLTQEQFRDLQCKYCMQNNETNAFEMPVEMGGIWIRKVQSDARLPRDCLSWRSLCGSSIAELLHKAENKTTSPDPYEVHNNWDDEGSAENSSDGICKFLHGRSSSKMYKRSIASRMWPSGYYIRPKGMP